MGTNLCTVMPQVGGVRKILRQDWTMIQSLAKLCSQGVRKDHFIQPTLGQKKNLATKGSSFCSLILCHLGRWLNYIREKPVLWHMPNSVAVPT